MNYSFTTSIGIDVSKHLLDVYYDGDGTYERFDNSADGIKKLIRWISKRAEQALVVIEPTGGYEHMLQHMVLTNKTMHLAKVNARQIREFARANGRIAKTDSINASCVSARAAFLRQQIRDIDAVIRNLIAEHGELKELNKLIRSVTGIGPQTAAVSTTNPSAASSVSRRIMSIAVICAENAAFIVAEKLYATCSTWPLSALSATMTNCVIFYQRLILK